MRQHPLLIGLGILASCVFAGGAAGQGLIWLDQFGGSGLVDVATGVSSDSTYAYVVGYTEGRLLTSWGNRAPHAGGRDAFVRCYQPTDGTLLWTQEFGTAQDDYARAGSGPFVAGSTGGVLPGQTSAGGTDAFVAGATGEGLPLIWQFGSAGDDGALGVGVCSPLLVAVGYAGGSVPGNSHAGGKDAFVWCYSGETVAWTAEFGSPADDEACDVDVSLGVPVVVGWTVGGLPGQPAASDREAFVRVYSLDGTEFWTRQFGTAGDDAARAVCVASHDDVYDVYVAGSTNGALGGQGSAGSFDVFVRKYDLLSGEQLWTRQFGSSSWDYAYDICGDSTGVYVCGATGGALPGQLSSGGSDYFVRKYTFDGTELWTRQCGSAADDEAAGISADASGVYLAGWTDGALPGQRPAADREAFIQKLDPGGGTCGPASLGCLL